MMIEISELLPTATIALIVDILIEVLRFLKAKLLDRKDTLKPKLETLLLKR